MTTRRSVLAVLSRSTGLALLAGLTFATAACTGSTAGPAASGTSGAETLTAAVAKTKGQSFRYTLSYGTGLTGDGAEDVGAGKAVMNVVYADATSGISVKIGGLVVNSRVLVKMDFGALAGIPGLGGLSDTWMRVDTAKAPRLASFGMAAGSNMVSADTYVKAIVSAENTSATEVKGTLDLAKAAPPATSAQDIERLSATDRVAAFTATLDRDGRIVRLAITMPKVAAYPAAQLVISYSDYGATVVVPEPAANKIVEAPALIYTFLQV